jgi:peptidoglycan-N-acetylmuramic acid deacetylase
LYHAHKTYKLAVAIAIALLWGALYRQSLIQADGPQGESTAERPAQDVSMLDVALTASDDGPFFSLDDLALYTPVPRTPPMKWEIKPLLKQAYPAEVKSIPFVPREYATETVAYLAEHEILHGDRQRPYVALTFDCEAGSGSMQKILDVLCAQQTHATFFVLGKYAYLYPDMVRQIATDGHEIGNHSFFHPLFTAITPTVATQEITYTEAAIDWAVGQHVPMRYIRFPYGGRNYANRLHAAALGYQSAFWNIDPRGWDPAKTVTDVVEHVRHTAHKGGIVIMHCGSWDDANALADVIQVIRDLGMIPGTLTDVLSTEDYDIPDYPKLWRPGDELAERVCTPIGQDPSGRFPADADALP